MGRGRRGERLGPIFERLANVLEEDRDGLSLLDDPSSIAPERALVLEVAGSLVDFQALAARMRRTDLRDAHPDVRAAPGASPTIALAPLTQDHENHHAR